MAGRVVAKRLIGELRSSSGLLRQVPQRSLHGIPSASPLVRESLGGGAAGKFHVPKRDLHLNEHSFHELALDYGFTEFEPLYKVLRFIVIYRFIAEAFL